jgi:hypothetical protein
LAFVTRLVNQELLLRNEYLASENRILRAHLPRRLRLTDSERSTLDEFRDRRSGPAAVVEPGLLASAMLAVALALMHASSNSKPTTLSNSASGLPLLIAHMRQRGAPLHRGAVRALSRSPSACCRWRTECLEY